MLLANFPDSKRATKISEIWKIKLFTVLKSAGYSKAETGNHIGNNTQCCNTLCGFFHI